MKSSIFYVLGQKWPFFKFFRTDFFYELLISIQEGLLKALVLVPPLFAAENHHSVSSYRCQISLGTRVILEGSK